MTPADRRKLVGILGLLSSNHDGERAAAGLLACRLLRATGVTWDDVVAGGSPAPTQGAGPPCAWQADIALAQRNISLLSEWEKQFTHSVASQRFLSTKQQAILLKIADGLRARGRK